MVPPETIFGVPAWIAVYGLSFAGFAVAAWAAYRRVFRLVLMGRPSGRFDRPVRRLLGAVPLVFGQRKVLQSVSLRRDRAGIAHAVIFWGFLSFVASYLVFIYGDAVDRDFSSALLTEGGARAFSVYIDLLAGLLLVVLAWALLRRWAARPRRLSFDLTQSLDSVVVVGLTGLLMTLTLATEAFYVASGGAGPEASAPIGSAIGGVLKDRLGLSAGAAADLQAVAWWAHLGAILGFGIYVPFSKHTHLIGAPFAFFMRRLEPMGTLSTPKDLETAESFGASRARELTSRQLLDGFACAVCGRCTDSCPANLTGKTLSPMHVVAGLKEHVAEVGTDAAGANGGRELVGGIVGEEALWDCVTCGACEQECPVGVEHLDTIVDMRRHLVMERASMPDTAMNALVNMEQRGHPWRGTTYGRTDWADGLGVPTLAEHPNAEVLLWVGCTAALEQRSQRIARAMASVLKRAGVDFAILGDEEGCTGDPARRMGNEYLYQTMAQRNVELLNGYDVKRIVTLCPHCFNAIKNEYPHLGGSYRVQHYSELVSELIADGRIRPVATIEATVAYHDSCYLGRHNGVYDPPRRIMEAIPGVRLVEAERCRERGFCCGAGGGHMWMEESRGDRINHARAEQLLETGADTVAVSCPFCLQMLDEGVTAKAPEGGGTRVRDLLEILDESLG